MSRVQPLSIKKLFGRQRPLHDLFGGGKVANIVLWRDKRQSAAILMGVTAIWLLFEVMEYNFLSLVCHISIIAMLLVFLWSNGAALLNMPPPKIPELILSEKAFTKAASTFQNKLSQFLTMLHDIACGGDLRLFLWTIVSLFVISAIGSCCSFMNLLFFAILCIQTLPALYERYEDEVDYLATKGLHELMKLMEKIPRGPPKKSN